MFVMKEYTIPTCVIIIESPFGVVHLREKVFKTLHLYRGVTSPDGKCPATQHAFILSTSVPP